MNETGRPIRALAGHAIDLYRMAIFDVSNPHSYSKFRTLKSVQRRTGAKTLIETGTFRGVTTRRCAPLFQRIYTIEIDPQLASAAARHLKPFPHITVIEGDAQKEVLRILSSKTERDVLIFLDGHYSGAGTGMGDKPEPAADILEALGKHVDSIVGIVVDDFREFGAAPGWPKKWELIRSAEEAFAPHGFRLTIHLDQLLLERS
jgi:hypothetical protein